MRISTKLKAAAKGFMNPDQVAPTGFVNWMQQLEQTSEPDKQLNGIWSCIQVLADRALQHDKEKEAWAKAPGRWDRIFEITAAALKKADVTKGKMLEIGGRQNPRNGDFPGFEYEALDLDGAPSAGIVVTRGDITKCPQIADDSYDFIFSLDVFEHIDKPWLAASEIQRILKPGGVTMHSTLFSWRYHPCPIDYWRYTAEGLKSLFDQLDCVHSDFDYTERRRDVRGRGRNKMAADALGGWRENIRVNYAGIKR